MQRAPQQLKQHVSTSTVEITEAMCNTEEGHRTEALLLQRLCVLAKDFANRDQFEMDAKLVLPSGLYTS